MVFAADLGGTHLRVATIDHEGKISQRKSQPAPQTDANDIVRALVDAFRESQSSMLASGQRITAISVAVPGTVNAAEGIVVKTPNIPCLSGFPLVYALRGALGCPVFLENDANAAALGELWCGAGRGAQSMICITLGTGVGGGIILDGKLWRGADGSAGEIGHLAIDPFNGVVCSCGSRGCLEVYASATAVVRMTRELLPSYPDSSLHGAADLTAHQIYQAGCKGDPLALEVFRRMGSSLGIGLASLINVLNPERIVIGGGLSNGWDLFETQVRQQVLERAFPIPALRVKILRTRCGDNAGLLGAAWLAFRE